MATVYECDRCSKRMDYLPTVGHITYGLGNIGGQRQFCTDCFYKVLGAIEREPPPPERPSPREALEPDPELYVTHREPARSPWGRLGYWFSDKPPKKKEWK